MDEQKMDPQMEENLAISTVQKAEGNWYVYKGSEEPLFFGDTGHFEVMGDMNCCAPTDAVLFAFITNDGRRLMMDAPSLLKFFHACRPSGSVSPDFS